MLKSYKFRLYPTEQQQVLISKHIGACRFVYNLALETKNLAYSTLRKNISIFDLMHQMVDLKKECEWLRDVDSQALQQSLIDLDRSFTSFFKGFSKFPSFKKKNQKMSFRNPHGARVVVENGLLFQPKFTDGIKIILSQEMIGEIRNTTISKTPTGKYFVSILCDTGEAMSEKEKIKEKTAIGIDLGIKDFIVTSDGLKTNNPKHLKAAQSRLKFLQRQASKKKKGSSNQKKAYLKVALSHEKVANQRKDFLQKLSTQLIKNHDTLCLENLNIAGMVKNHNLAGAISDAGWGQFVEMLKYKGEWYGKNILQIPTFEPSTKICSSCGASNQKLTLADREWTCVCGVKHDRDINAAINIKKYCVGVQRKKSVELPTLAGALKQKIK